jgi:ferredoxin
MPKIVFVSEKQEVEVPEGTNLREAAMKAGIQVYHGVHRYLNCWGHGLCGSCRMLVKKGTENLSPKTKLERFTLYFPLGAAALATIGHEDEMRLSCQAQVKGDVTVETKPTFNWSGENFWQKPFPNK